MSCKKLYLSNSILQGTGLYTSEFIEVGDVVMLWNVDAFLINEKEYNQRQANGDAVVEMTGVRYVSDYFLYTDERPRYENYINHSFTPNILYHCGVCFALEDIEIGSELTVDYSYMLSESDDMGFVDGITGREVKGLHATVGLLESSKLLQKILEKKLNNRSDSKKETEKDSKKESYLHSLYIDV